jgi:hypothetical protein
MSFSETGPVGRIAAVGLLAAGLCYCYANQSAADGGAELFAQGGKGKPVVGGRWNLDYSQALQAARKSGKPLLVVFRCEK